MLVKFVACCILPPLKVRGSLNFDRLVEIGGEDKATILQMQTRFLKIAGFFRPNGLSFIKEV